MASQSIGPKQIAALLHRTRVLVSACDLDLMVFLYRHPRTFLTSERLAQFVGYDLEETARSLDRFIDAGVLERTQNPNHAARMYLLTLDGPHGDGLKELLEVASSSREGRSHILQALQPPGTDNAPRQKRSPLGIIRIA